MSAINFTYRCSIPVLAWSWPDLVDTRDQVGRL